MADKLNKKYFQLKSPPTIMEIIDGEAILINGEKGTYYNLSPQATLIFEAILNGYSLEELFTLNNLESKVCDHIYAIIDKLISEDILIEIESIKRKKVSPIELNIKNYNKDIVFTIYEDMQDMLALDPIHEVDEVIGWPSKK